MAHHSVLLHEALNGLLLKEGDTALDGTLGAGGHAEAICQAIGKKGLLIGLDRDSEALERVRGRLEAAPCQSELRCADFRNLGSVLREVGVSNVTAILFDLGWSSDQLESSGRGFSFQKDEPLLMTYAAHPTDEDLTAAEILNTWDEENIEAILTGYGEERFARTIAKRIVESRAERPFTTTFDLVEVVEQAVPVWPARIGRQHPGEYRHRRIHPATKTFQALRIAVNDEIEGLREGLAAAIAHLSKNGRVAVISFHSIEDRVVKHFFKQQSAAHMGIIITKRPVTPTAEEIAENPRSRSAKLRIFQRT